MKKHVLRLFLAACCLVLLLPTVSASAEKSDWRVDGVLIAASGERADRPAGELSLSARGSLVGSTVAVETQGTGNNYQLMDSLDPGGPVPTATAGLCTTGYGTVFPSDQGVLDDVFTVIDLPFAFTLYGKQYVQTTVAVNGWASFGDSAIAPFLTDLEFDDPAGNFGNVYTCVQGAAGSRQFHIEWFNADCYVACDGTVGEHVSFEMVLYEADNSIVFNYWDTEFLTGYSGNDGGGALIGIASDMSRRLEYTTPELWYSTNQDTILASPFAIRFFVPTCWSGFTGDEPPATLVTTRAGTLVKGTAADDVIVGHFGDDTIFGAQGNDRICGGAGDDVLKGRGGADIIDGGDGNDIIDGGGGLDQLDGSFGDDIIDGRGAADVIYGWEGNDTLAGQEGADFIVGENGDDTITGQTGPDTLDGDDVVFGNNSSGNDTVRGGNGNDTLYGGPGTDLCAGNLGPNDMADTASCEATPGVETLF